MSSFKSNVARGAASLLGSDLTLINLLTQGLVDWEGLNLDVEHPQDSMRYAATVVEGQVTTHANALQLQASGLDSSVNAWVEDCQVLFDKNVALVCEVEVLKQTVEQMDGELGVLLAQVEALEWVNPLEYLSVKDLLRLGAEGDIMEMDTTAASNLALCPDFSALVDRPEPLDTATPLFLQ
ncbi:hypothetical protein BDM02DRAFT_3132749 [Thelephora ganbajun]|uniref:Uncharacterized protein n=1 Tax=Thelephora ganbajun TaxID=370292 RepID=A0ACB6Z0F6_THEGA|nr:hypothetical protein BDM02DRAFT_3132749 [Thelephora ganbajun]